MDSIELRRRHFDLTSLYQEKLAFTQEFKLIFLHRRHFSTSNHFSRNIFYFAHAFHFFSFALHFQNVLTLGLEAFELLTPFLNYIKSVFKNHKSELQKSKILQQKQGNE